VTQIIGHLYTPLATTSNYNAVTIPHTLQITRPHAKSSQFAFTSRFLVTHLNNEDPSASLLTSLLSGEYPTTELSQFCRPGVVVTYPQGGPNRKHRFQQFLYCCYGRLSSDSPDIADVFTGRYQATHVPSRDRCIATVLHTTILTRIFNHKF
jgi:hypothetical protein